MSLQERVRRSGGLNYEAIEQEMVRLMSAQEELVESLAALASEHAGAEAEFKVQFHSERYLARTDTSNGRVSADMAEDIAVMQTADARRKAEALKARMDATRQALLTTRSNQESLRSLMASHRDVGA
jgi:hypothetical protein